MSITGGGSGKGGVDAPSFANVDLTPGMMSSGSAIASAFGNEGLSDSTMETQAQNANVEKWDVAQANLNNKMAQTQFQDQLTADNQDQGGFSLGLGSLAGLF